MWLVNNPGARVTGRQAALRNWARVHVLFFVSGVRETPAEFDSEVMTMLKEFIKNKDKESRIAQPDLYVEAKEKAQ